MSIINFNFVDFCHDSANHVNTLALAAPKVQFSIFNSQFIKPISCALYPIRVKQFSNGLVGLNYNRWKICDGARKKGRELKIPVYRFLREPLIRRFGEEWYKELCDIAENALYSE